MFAFFSMKWEYNYIALLKQKQFRCRLDKTALVWRLFVIGFFSLLTLAFVGLAWNMNTFLNGLVSTTLTLSFLFPAFWAYTSIEARLFEAALWLTHNRSTSWY